MSKIEDDISAKVDMVVASAGDEHNVAHTGNSDENAPTSVKKRDRTQTEKGKQYQKHLVENMFNKSMKN